MRCYLRFLINTRITIITLLKPKICVIRRPIKRRKLVNDISFFTEANNRKRRFYASAEIRHHLRREGISRTRSVYTGTMSDSEHVSRSGASQRDGMSAPVARSSVSHCYRAGGYASCPETHTCHRLTMETFSHDSGGVESPLRSDQASFRGLVSGKWPLTGQLCLVWNWTSMMIVTMV